MVFLLGSSYRIALRDDKLSEMILPDSNGGCVDVASHVIWRKYVSAMQQDFSEQSV